MRRKDAISPWERQPGETEKAYEAFLIYKNMGPGRILKAVAQKLHKSYTLVRRWRDKNHWQERITAFDRENEKQQQIKLQEEQAKMVKRHLKASILLQGKAIEALQKVAPEDLTANDIRNLLKLGIELETETRKTLEVARDAGITITITRKEAD